MHGFLTLSIARGSGSETTLEEKTHRLLLREEDRSAEPRRLIGM